MSVAEILPVTEKVYPENLEESIKKYQGLIKWYANKYQKPTIQALNFDDLVQEGFLKLMEVYEKGFRGKEFEKMFKSSLPNHMIDLSRRAYSPVRNGVIIELDDQMIGDGDEHLNEIFFEQSFGHFYEMLDDEQKQVLSELLEPSQASTLEAKKEMFRKRKLLAQGQHVRGYASSEVKKKHIAKALNMSKSTFESIVSSVRCKAKKDLFLN